MASKPPLSKPPILPMAVVTGAAALGFLTFGLGSADSRTASDLDSGPSRSAYKNPGKEEDAHALMPHRPQAAPLPQKSKSPEPRSEPSPRPSRWAERLQSKRPSSEMAVEKPHEPTQSARAIRPSPEPEEAEGSPPYMPDYSGGKEDEMKLFRYVRSVVKEELVPLVYRCVGDRYHRDPNIEEKVELEMTVSGSAVVGGVVVAVELGEKITVEDPQERECIRQSAYPLGFKAPPEAKKSSKWCTRS